MKEFLSKLEEMDTKTGYKNRSPIRYESKRFDRLTAASNNRLEAEIKENDERVGDGEAEHKRKEGSRQHTLTILSVQGGCRRSPENRFCDSSRSPKTDSAITAGHPVTRERTLQFPSGHQRTDSALHPVTREWILVFSAGHQRTDSAIPARNQVTREHILRVSTNHPINIDCIPGVLARHRVT